MAEGTERLRKGLDELAKILKRETQTSLKQLGKKATGTLIESIDVAVKEQLNKFTITESHIFYGAFTHKGKPAGVEVGRRKKARRVPIDALEAWIKATNFAFRAKTIRGAAFAIQTNIFKFGIKKAPFLQNTLDRTEGKVIQIVEKAASENLEVAINQIFRATDKKFKITV